MPAKTARNVYDPRVRELIRATGNPDLFPELNIPRSTISGWLRGDFKPAVGAEAVSQTEIELHARLAKLERRIQILVAVLRLLLALVRVSGCRLTGERLPTDKAKADILRAVDAARKTLPLRSAVRVLGLSLSRYHAWKQAERACDLADRPSCPKTFPGQLTGREVATIQDMVTAQEYRHVPTSTLAVLAQRLGRVFASASTWCRLVRTRGWRRPRTRVYPAKPKVGLGIGPLRRVLAQVDIVESNSLLEVWWRSLRHQWLYLNTLDTAAAVRRLVSFYVAEHNQVLPHSALNGRTPDEKYFGQAEDIAAKLAAARKVARDERLAVNRALSCAACTATGTSDANQASAA
jgi:hypothetical protein